jgi:hypothetical protein
MAELITIPMRDFLIEHIDRQVPFVANYSPRLKTTLAAITKGYVRPDNRGVGRPKNTYLTEKGRGVLAAALGDWADALERAHYQGEEWPHNQPGAAAGASSGSEATSQPLVASAQ